MKVKEEQWMRTKENIIRKMDNVNDYDYYVIKVANTPKELIQEGDLIKIEDGLFIVMYIENGTNIYIYNNDFVYTQLDTRYVTEIWTKTSDDTYTKQWRKDND
jgi:hypothetical protein